jgi:hypothetical protein
MALVAKPIDTLLALFSHLCEAGSLTLAADRPRALPLFNCPGIAFRADYGELTGASQVRQLAYHGSFHAKPVSRHSTKTVVEQQFFLCGHPNRWRQGLTSTRHSVEDCIQPMTNFSRTFLVCSSLAASLLLACQILAQNPPPSSSTPKSGAPKTDPQTRITIEVTGGEKETPIENASVYVKYIEEHKIKRDKKLELNVKTNRDGVAHVPDAPLGRVLIQIIAEGWKSYGRWFDITDPKQTIKIHLERPPKWY